MPVFQYKAYNEAGQIKSGVEDADSARDARTSLRRKGLHVTDITELESEGEKRSSRLREWWISRQTAGHVPQLTRQMATLLKSGVPLVQSLSALIDQVDNGVLVSRWMFDRDPPPYYAGLVPMDMSWGWMRFAIT